MARDVSEERGHLPFQVLDASAIEGSRGLAGESSSIYSCIQIYKALTPLAPPSVSRRDGSDGPGAPSYVGSSEERPCPDCVCSPARTHGCGCGELGAPPPAGRQTGCCAPVLRGAPVMVCPTCCPAPPLSHCCAACACPARPRRKGRGTAPCWGEPGTTLTLALSLTPLTRSSSLWLPLCLQHSTPYSTLLPQILPCSTLLPLFSKGWGGAWILPSSKPPCSSLLLAIPGRRGFTLCPFCLRRCSERG